MKKSLIGVPFLFFITLLFSSCDTINEKNASLSIIYGATALLAVLLLCGYCFLIKKKSNWFLLLFSSVVVVDVGYFLLSSSNSLEEALWANRIAYFGSVFLPLAMFFIILDVTNAKYGKALPYTLIAVSAVVFLIAASPGILTIYYKEVSFDIINGSGILVKEEYGPLHPLYFVYLVVYFASMVVSIIRASAKKTIESPAHAIVLAIAVFANIGVWFIEQVSDIKFEMLSVSYIISELFLLGVHLVVSENQRLNQLIHENKVNNNNTTSSETDGMKSCPVIEIPPDDERIRIFLAGHEQLTQTEKRIFDAYIVRVTTKEIMASLNITENTLKFHNKNIYGKLNVSSRKELLEIHKLIKAQSPESITR